MRNKKWELLVFPACLAETPATPGIVDKACNLKQNPGQGGCLKETSLQQYN